MKKQFLAIFLYMRNRIVILNYPILNFYLKKQLGGQHHLRANIEGLQSFADYQIIITSFNWRIWTKQGNITYIHLGLFFNHRKQRGIEYSNGSVNNFKRIWTNCFKSVYNFCLTYVLRKYINFFQKKCEIIYYERANKTLEMGELPAHLKILEVNDEYFPNNYQKFNIILCVNNSHIPKTNKNVTLINQPWPSNVKFLREKKDKQNLVIIDSSPFGINQKELEETLLFLKNRLNLQEIVYLGEKEIDFNPNLKIKCSDLISNNHEYLKLIRNFKYAFISYGPTLSQTRAVMGFPMKFIDLLSSGTYIYSDTYFPLVKGYSLEKFILTDYTSKHEISELDFLRLEKFFKQVINPKLYFERIFN